MEPDSQTFAELRYADAAKAYTKLVFTPQGGQPFACIPIQKRSGGILVALAGGALEERMLHQRWRIQFSMQLLPQSV